MVVTLEEIKQYVRIDSADEDELLLALSGTAESICKDILRCSFEPGAEVPDPVRTAVLYGISYLYENREQADFKDLGVESFCLVLSNKVSLIFLHFGR